MNKTNIHWPWKPLYTWNPVTGCKRGCSYCYARRLHNRFYPGPFSDIVLHENRLDDPAKLSAPSNIFVGSMSDPEYWSEAQWNAVDEACCAAAYHKYLFLSKNAESYRNAMNGDLFTQIGCVCGVTVTGNRAEDKSNIETINEYGEAFISVEPLLGPVHIPESVARWLKYVIVGAMTGPGAVPVKQEWIDSITATVPAEKIYWKRSMKKYGEKVWVTRLCDTGGRASARLAQTERRDRMCNWTDTPRGLEPAIGMPGSAARIAQTTPNDLAHILSAVSAAIEDPYINTLCMDNDDDRATLTAWLTGAILNCKGRAHV